jgi:ubiquinone/menaquinone biosynthesis C-methylase UbiE
MAEQYDELASKYQGTNLLSCRLIEEHAVRGVLGSVEGQAVLDLACGDGEYSRKLKKWGATRVVGVDISSEMIQYARRAEQEQPLGIEYHVSDVAELDVLGTFDAALAVYMLHYAPSREHMLRMCQRIHAHLKPEGRFVTYAVNPDFSARLPNTTKYGVSMVDYPESPREGQPTTILLHLQTPITLHAFYWSRATHEWALREAGFRDIAWTRPTCPPEGLAGLPPAYWQGYVDNPQAVVLSARR